MVSARALLLVSALCWPGACAAPEPAPPAPVTEVTVFRVYNLREITGQSLDDEGIETFLAMIRDAVGEKDWYEHSSTVQVLGGVMTVRTTPEGQERLEQFFSKFRIIGASQR
ncbi:MAG TPA: hypothetical protein VFD43_14085 [Planctomycetota bacterium]|nr:hypothetical protein [Planctomycetota bacterium]